MKRILIIMFCLFVVFGLTSCLENNSNISSYDDEYHYFSDGNKEKHQFGSWQIIHEATADVVGLKQRKCSKCAYVEDSAIEYGDDTGKFDDHVHQFGDYEYDENYHFKSCSCGAVREKEAHDFTETKKNNITTYTCKVCGYSYSEEQYSTERYMVSEEEYNKAFSIQVNSFQVEIDQSNSKVCYTFDEEHKIAKIVLKLDYEYESYVDFSDLSKQYEYVRSFDTSGNAIYLKNYFGINEMYDMFRKQYESVIKKPEENGAKVDFKTLKFDIETNSYYYRNEEQRLTFYSKFFDGDLVEIRALYQASLYSPSTHTTVVSKFNKTPLELPKNYINQTNITYSDFLDSNIFEFEQKDDIFMVPNSITSLISTSGTNVTVKNATKVVIPTEVNSLFIETTSDKVDIYYLGSINTFRDKVNLNGTDGIIYNLYTFNEKEFKLAETGHIIDEHKGEMPRTDDLVYFMMGDFSNWEITDEYMMQPTSVNKIMEISNDTKLFNKLCKDIEDGLIKSLYIGEAPIGSKHLSWNCKALIDNEVYLFDGSFAAKIALANWNDDDNDEQIQWIPTPRDAYAFSLTPDTFFNPSWQEELDEYGFCWNNNSVVIGESGIYYIIVAEYKTDKSYHKYGIGAIFKEDIEYLDDVVWKQKNANSCFIQFGNSETKEMQINNGFYEIEINVMANDVFQLYEKRENNIYSFGTYDFDDASLEYVEEVYNKTFYYFKAGGKYKISISVGDDQRVYITLLGKNSIEDLFNNVEERVVDADFKPHTPFKPELPAGYRYQALAEEEFYNPGHYSVKYNIIDSNGNIVLTPTLNLTINRPSNEIYCHIQYISPRIGDIDYALQVNYANTNCIEYIPVDSEEVYFEKGGVIKFFYNYNRVSSNIGPDENNKYIKVESGEFIITQTIYPVSVYFKVWSDGGFSFYIDGEIEAPSEGYGIYVGNDLYVLIQNEKPLDPAFTEWMVQGVVVDVFSEITIINFATRDVWTIKKLENNSSEKVYLTSDKKHMFIEPGKFDIYLKLQFNNDSMYIGEVS